MRVRFWGTRGSLPVALTAAETQEKVAQALVAAAGRRFGSIEEAREFAARDLPFAGAGTFGGNSSCVELEPGGDEYFVCDLGSGARPFGGHVFARQRGKPAVINVFMSHLHWDHIMGFPFFGPAYVPGMKIRIHGCHDQLEHAFRRQQAQPSFPVEFDQLRASIEFVRLSPGTTIEVSGVRVTPKLQNHSGDSFGYRFERGGKTFVYTTDSEHKLENAAEAQTFADFFRDADLVVFDAMYSLADAISVRADWGHSSNMVGVELCQMAGAKHLALFHHEPANNDAAIEAILHDTRKFAQLARDAPPLQVSAAYDGLVIDL